jgi:carbonic anhydrase
MRLLKDLFDQNKQWAAKTAAEDPDFFAKQSSGQAPDILWIGCADSRVPANVIIGAHPGKVFVHRNVANVFVHSDLNALSVLQYAVEVLKVKHVVVCGHYSCGGVTAAMGDGQYGLIDNWLRHIKDVAERHLPELDAISDPKKRADRLSELNVAAQMRNVSRTTIVQNAWDRGQELAVHGWVYGLNDGILRDLNLCVDGPEQLSRAYAVGAG